jgi:SynChlorMet cassette protein ScmC
MTMRNMSSLFDSFTIRFADGSTLLIEAGNAASEKLVRFLAIAARLSPSPTSRGDDLNRLWIVDESSNADQHHAVLRLEFQNTQSSSTSEKDRYERSTSRFKSGCDETWMLRKLVRLSTAIEQDSPRRVLLHGGLVVSPSGKAVLLAGPSGIGKSTAVFRLPPSYCPLSDDTTLIVRDAQGRHWAHPWPTWSHLLDYKDDARRSTWDVQQAVELSAIFILRRAYKDRVEPIETRDAIGFLLDLAKQTSAILNLGMRQKEIRLLNTQRFENILAMVRSLPIFWLYLGRDGAFWQEIEQVLCQDLDET